LIKRVVLSVLLNEQVDKCCSVGVLVTDDFGIREYNRLYRGIDRATDVLSFPMQSFDTAGWNGHGKLEFDEETGVLPLGDIIISMESVRRQAVEYNNTIKYEAAYLIIHSVLHLLGYDHEKKSTEELMHKKTNLIMKETGFDI